MKVFLFSHQKNFRDIGGLKTLNGKKVKYGRIFRGGYISRPNDEDIALLKSLNITDAIDFRSEQEHQNRPHSDLIGWIKHNFPPMEENKNALIKKQDDGNLLWFLDNPSNAFKHMKGIYENLLVSDIGIKAYRSFFNILLEDNRIVYFHCSQGKDRAGLAAFILELALGVSFEDAKKDYLRTNVAMKLKKQELKSMLKNKSYYDDLYEKALDVVFTAKVAFLQAAIDSVINKYGSFDYYFDSVLKIDRKRLQKLYTE